MGQDESKPEPSHKPFPIISSSILSSARKSVMSKAKTLIGLDCEGLLKLRSTPFKNSIEI